MTEWGVVGALAVLVPLAASIIAPIIKLTKTITKLTVVMDGLRATVEANRIENKASHERIWDHNKEQDDAISNHETRISILEKSPAAAG